MKGRETMEKRRLIKGSSFDDIRSAIAFYGAIGYIQSGSIIPLGANEYVAMMTKREEVRDNA